MSQAMQIIQQVELDKFMVELNQSRRIPAELRTKRLALQQELTTLERSELVPAKEALQIESDVLFLAINEETDEKGKAKYSNEATRNAALRIRQSEDPTYQRALAKVRAIEAKVEHLKNQIADVDEMIKSESERIWSLRDLVKGAVTALNVIAVYDGPKLPTEIHLVNSTKGVA